MSTVVHVRPASRDRMTPPTWTFTKIALFECDRDRTDISGAAPRRIPRFAAIDGLERFDGLQRVLDEEDIFSLLPMGRENAETVMIVGHNPGLEKLVEQLTGERQDLPTATLAQIRLPIDQWRDLKLSTRRTLVGLWRPEELT